SAVSVFGVKIDTTQATDKAKDYIDNEKLNKAQEAIRDGGVICFDDFERKSKKIDLNDLFGVLTQLSLDFNCKVVIILNSDVFEGEEANVFKTVKEKTVNKFFYFEPTIEELFNSIYESNEKYKKLDAYRAEILKAIEETEELNARIYIQVLDNCLEWIGKGYDKNTIRSLVFISVNFILNDLILTKPIRIKSGYSQFENIVYSEINYPDNRLCMASPARKISENNIKFEDMTGRKLGGKEYNQKTSLIEKIFEILSENKKTGHEFSETEQVAIRSWINKNKRKLDAIWKYGYQLYCMDTIDDSTYNKQANFVKSGILLKNHKESS
ncbi:MAG: hypothetical protein LGB78_04230, partial [Sulfurovum sp.]|nr:hypothetical protein [Sulfurovum sp.]